MIPRKSIAWDTGEDGKVYLLKEKSHSRITKKLIDLFNKEQYFRIHFDEIGTYVWNHIDGSRSVKDLGLILSRWDERGEITQVEERVEKFILMLLKNKFVELK